MVGPNISSTKKRELVLFVLDVILEIICSPFDSIVKSILEEISSRKATHPTNSLPDSEITRVFLALNWCDFLHLLSVKDEQWQRNTSV